MVWYYDMAYGLAAAASAPVWATRLLRTGKWRTDWPGRFGRGPSVHGEGERPGRTLLIHAVSVGEVNLIRQLVAELERDGRLRLVISATTDTGYARAQELFGERHEVVRYPLDFTTAVERFLDRVRPDAVALVELEVWPNFVAACDQRGIPVGVINGRLSERSFGRYRLVRSLVRPTFAKLSAAAVQTPAYAERFEALGVQGERVEVLDTMKWDTAQLADEVAGAEELAERLQLERDRPLVVAGSTGPGEERMLIERCPGDVQLLLVPRKPERFEKVAGLSPEMVRWSDPAATAGAARRLYLLDTMGKLRAAYALADVCIVGRSFLGLYGSDMIEPIALGKPTLVGPYHRDFADTVEALVQGGGWW